MTGRRGSRERCCPSSCAKRLSWLRQSVWLLRPPSRRSHPCRLLSMRPGRPRSQGRHDSALGKMRTTRVWRVPSRRNSGVTAEAAKTWWRHHHGAVVASTAPAAPTRRRHHGTHQCIERAAAPWHTLHLCIVRAYGPYGRRMEAVAELPKTGTSKNVPPTERVSCKDFFAWIVRENRARPSFATTSMRRPYDGLGRGVTEDAWRRGVTDGAWGGA